MTNQQILKKATEKAKKSGFNIDKLWEKIKNRAGGENLYKLPYEVLIFSHDFAKAFWGEENFVDIFYEDGEKCIGRLRVKNWEFNLMEMVKQKEPLKYIEKFL